MGRHPALCDRFGTPEAVGEALDAYFAQCDAEERPYTHTGVSLALGMLEGGPGLWAYVKAPPESERGQFQEPIKKAIARVDAQYEERLASGKPVGSIFALKNRGWTDQQQIQHQLAGDGWGDILSGLGQSANPEGDSE